MPIRDCRSCKHMLSINADKARCRQYEIENGIIQERRFERPLKACERYKEVKETRQK